MEELIVEENQWLTNVITTTLVKNQQFLKNFSETSAATFKIRDLNIKIIGAEESFMLTICYRACVTFEFMGEVETRSLVIKKTPKVPPEIYDDINFDALFNNEIQSYKNILPAFVEIANNDFNLTKLYHGEIGNCYANVIMEDFSSNGWGVAKDRTNLSLEHVMLTVKYLAKFHACGFAMRYTRRKDFDALTSTLKESRYAKSTIHPDYNMFVIATGQRLVDATQKLQPSVPLEFSQRLCKMQQTFLKYQKQRVAPVEPMITLCHGDFLRNNIAYKYEDENREKPIDVMMFDLQTLRIGSPMIDLVIFLGLSAFTEVRHQHFNDIFTTYCDELAAAFKAYSKSDDLPSYLDYDDLIKEYVRLLPYSISIAAAFLPVLVETQDISVQELMTQQRTPEEIELEAMTRGGIVVDTEVANQVKELYELMIKYNVDIFNGCDY